MKSLIILSLLILILYIIGFLKRPTTFNWMDRSFTTAIKGFSILTIVWAHSGARCGVGGIQFIAGIGVSLFLMCSGYGLEMSYKKNGLAGFWKKRLVGVCLPFWIVELVGLIITQSFSIEKYALDAIFLKPATSYGWFMGYIVVCYIIFYVVKRLISNKRANTVVLFGGFVAWFIIDSLFIANPDMPFLRARQMLSFPCGILISQHKEYLEQHLKKTKSGLIFVGGSITCLLFMAITQLDVIKQMPYLISNAMALLTCLPMAIGMLVLGKAFSIIFENKMLITVGTISYEVYLVHAFTLTIVSSLIINIFAFLVITGALSIVLHVAVKKLQIVLLAKC